ncbi:glycosyl transferase [Rhizobium sp. L245/93]|uniref:glycosyl transferase n=1 Tax=Rhizobium sp. L245/93 TaxID=2819998 RepID=UPI001AD9A730|nr:glycosyl transferase [Rhizobium sp. L245/93]MBO9169272.1 glycosyl transferase [Rhizobium sp. L245/93]
MSDRPWHRSLIKTGTRLLLGSARAHFQDAFPGLSVARATVDAPGEVRYRGAAVAALSSASILRSRSSDTLAIVGSGPSIAGNDLSRLPPQTAILLNGAISLSGQPVADALAVAVEDERFIWRHFDLLKQRVKDDTPCLFSVEVLRAICEIDLGFLRDRIIVLIDDIRKPYGARRRRYDTIQAFDFIRRDAAVNAGLSFDPDRGVFRGGSVAVSALQFALYCEPKTVGLFGIDISNAHQPRFYETTGETASSGIADAEARIVAHFVLARAVAAERGIEIVNYSPVSALAGAGFGYDDRFSPSRPA